MAQDQIPRRVITATLGGGLAEEWQQGTELSGVMAPLRPFQDKLGFFRGLTGRDNHGPANAALMTGAHWTKDVPKPNAPTIDWSLMKHFYPDGLPGALPFLSFGVRRRPAENILQEARVWDDTLNPIGVPTYTPNALFQTIFGRLPTQDAEDAAGEAAADVSILDAVVEQYRHYTSDAAGLSMASRARLSDHLDQIRSLERASVGLNIEGCEAPEFPADVILGDIDDAFPNNSRGAQEKGDPTHHIRQFNVMADLFTLALRCDLTRFGHALIYPLAAHGIFRGSYQSHDGTTVDFEQLRSETSDLNRHGDWHNTNHLLPRHTGEARARAMQLAGAYRKVGIDMLRYLLEALDAPESIETNGKTILENSVLFVVTELGTNHSGRGVLHALGPAGGTFRTGLIDVHDGATTRQFYDTILEAFDAPSIDSEVALGDSGTVSGVRR